MATALVVGDRREPGDSLAALLHRDRHQVHTSRNLDEAMGVLERHQFDVVLIDISMSPESDRLVPLRHVKARVPDVDVVVVAGFGSIAEAIDALKLGACDYLTTPVDPNRLYRSVQSAATRRQRAAQPPEADRTAFHGVVAADPVTQAVLAKACQVAAADVHVLITGESGTGKELVARAVHRYSARRARRFVPLNCAAVPESLVESELFGYKKGAFTGAAMDKKGLAEEAHGGVLFLDEIGDMPPYVQVSLLRFLDSGELRRVGETTVRHADVRVIAATHRNLLREIKEERFRHDLFYRLGATSLQIPPLRARRADIAPLARHYLQRAAALFGKPVQGLSEDGMALLQSYDWPGNVRQLKGVIETAVVLAERNVVDSADLITIMSESAGLDAHAYQAGGHELRRVKMALEQANGNRGQAASALGISRTTLWRRMRRFDGDGSDLDPQRSVKAGDKPR